MEKKYNIMELFSGIGGFTLGLQRAGFQFDKHYFSEIDKHAIANYKYNFKNAEYIGSVTDVRGERGQVDIITFGSPCQDFSLAGKRKGMDGERSSLIIEAIRLISEIRPSFFIWENVKGTFSSNDGADFWAILNAFANIGGYRLEWQLLNTSWFLPQNRERIYLIGHLANRSEPGVFPIGEEINMVKQRSTEMQVASCLAGSGGHIANGEYKGMNLVKVKSATSQGYEEAKEGDSINFSNPKTRRGRVGKGVAQTLDTQCNQGVIATTNYLQWDSSGKGHKSQQDRAFYENGNMGTIPSGRTENKVNVLTNNLQIRRLTEIECERLQGFDDSWRTGKEPTNWTMFGNYDGIIKQIPKTQRYKMLGNAVTVDVVEMIGKRLLQCLK